MLMLGRRPWAASRGTGFLALACCGLLLLVGCTPSGPPPPPSAPTAVASPGLSAPVRAAAALVAPPDLAFNGALPADGWHRCDERALDSILARYRAQFSVLASAGASWVHGTDCATGEMAGRVDQFVWLLSNENNASDVMANLNKSSYFADLPADARARLRQSRRGPVLLRTLAGDTSRGTAPRNQAELVAQDGASVLYIIVSSQPPLTSDDYFGLAQAALERLRSGRRG